MTNVFKIDSATAWKLCAAFCLAVVAVAMPDMAMAADASTDNAISKGLCNMISVLNGPVGKGVATVAIFFVGIALFMGKMSWSVALAVGLGVAAIFGAESIIETIAGRDVETCTGGAVDQGTTGSTPTN
ncbi:MAG: hypothetical protein K0R63_1621 [Rickettsiales bacterium]|jgi:type IV secretion system protein VirB2|nr:hypothetical protein [Rickettsiales bacterium]